MVWVGFVKLVEGFKREIEVFLRRKKFVCRW